MNKFIYIITNICYQIYKIIIHQFHFLQNVKMIDDQLNGPCDYKNQ